MKCPACGGHVVCRVIYLHAKLHRLAKNHKGEVVPGTVIRSAYRPQQDESADVTVECVDCGADHGEAHLFGKVGDAPDV